MRVSSEPEGCILSLMRLHFLLLLLFSLPAIAKRPINHEDVWTLKRTGAPAVSPNGKYAVVSVTEPA